MTETIKLWTSVKSADNGIKNVSLTYYKPVETAAKAAFLICPGGGYHHVSDREGDTIAKWLNAAGIHAFVVNYRVFPHAYPAQLQDACRAMRFIRHNAAMYNIDSEKIGIMGFSAGGHLASTVACYYKEDEKLLNDDIDEKSARPDLLVLGYPVITMGQFTHQGSRDALTGGKTSQELYDFLSNEKHVHSGMPPVFLWHTADDQGVPVQNSLLFSGALAEKNSF